MEVIVNDDSEDIDRLISLCRLRGHYDTPHLNQNLYFHSANLSCLDKCHFHLFYNLKSLHLSGNNITRISGLEYLSKLRCLYIQSNHITKIEGLESTLELRILDLSSNSIQRIENISHLLSLENINLENNAICACTAECGDTLAALPKLTQLNISRNEISSFAGSAPWEFFAKYVPSIKCLYLHGNSHLRPFKALRANLIQALPDLTYLDTRPVMPQERGVKLSEPPISPERAASITARRHAALERISMSTPAVDDLDLDLYAARMTEEVNRIEDATTQEDTASDRSLAEMD